MVSIQKQKDGWVVTGSTVEELLIGAEAIERLSVKEHAVSTNGEIAVDPAPNRSTTRQVLNNMTVEQKAAMSEALVRVNRRDQLRAFLKENGPMARGDIISKSGIPMGTINTTLNEKHFVQLKDGRWTAEKPEE